MNLLDKVQVLTKDSSKDFQSWIYFDGETGTNDAIYFHTENPNRNDFPIILREVEWDVELPDILCGIINENDFDIARSMFEGQISFYIYKKRLGLSLR